MVKELRRNTMVGAFMLVGLMALAWLMTSFGELPAIFGGKQYDMKIMVRRPSGIGEGTPVYLSGVQIGRVKELRFRDMEHLDSGVHIIAAIDEEYLIPNSATAMIQPAGLGLGRGTVRIEVVEGEQAPPLRPGEEIAGIMSGPFEGMIPDTLLVTVERSVARLGHFLEELTPVAQDLHEILEKHTVEEVDLPETDSRRLTANLYTVIQRFDSILKTFNDTFGDPHIREGLLQTFENVKQMSVDGRESLQNIKVATSELREDLKRLSTKLETGIDSANDHINEIAEDLRPVLENAAHLTSSLLKITLALERGEGTAGRFVRDPRLYESLLLLSGRLTEMADTLHRLIAKFEMDGEIRLNVPVGPFRHSTKIDIPEPKPK